MCFQKIFISVKYFASNIRKFKENHYFFGQNQAISCETLAFCAHPYIFQLPQFRTRNTDSLNQGSDYVKFCQLSPRVKSILIGQLQDSEILHPMKFCFTKYYGRVLLVT